jgi:lipoprotein signal peptidase
VVIFVLDQWSKTYFEGLLDLGQSIDLLPVFSWTLAYNTGAAFSFLHDAGGWQQLVLHRAWPWCDQCTAMTALADCACHANGPSIAWRESGCC